MPAAKKTKKKRPVIRRAVKKTASAILKKRKPSVRKKRVIVSKKTSAPKPASRSGEKVIGLVTHYFPRVMVAVVNLKGPLAVGDKIKIKGHTTHFTQRVVSIQIDHVVLKRAKKGDTIGLLVDSRVRNHDAVSKA
jgi:hypothetical protein